MSHRQVYDLGSAVAILTLDDEQPMLEIMEWDNGPTGFLIYGTDCIERLAAVLEQALQLVRPDPTSQDLRVGD